MGERPRAAGHEGGTGGSAPRGAGIEPLADLTIPAPGSTTAHRVLSRAIGRLLTDLAGLGRNALAAGIAGPDIPAFQRMVARALQTSPGALASALRSPTIGALLRCLRPPRIHEDPARGALLSELAALVALDLARTAALPEPLRLRRLPPRLLSLPGRFAVSIPADATGVLFENGRIAIERGATAPAERLDLDVIAVPEAGEDAPAVDPASRVTRPYCAIDRTIALALADNNPLAMHEAHPEKAGNAIDLGDHPASAWIASLMRALALVERYLPDLRREIDLYIHQIVPVGFDAERHLSASYQEAIGTIYLSLHPSPMTMAEALIHEFSHNKLNALFELDLVLENAWSPLYASPVRPDPRPLHGVLLAVHAFLPIARLYELMIEAGDPQAASAAFIERFERVREVNREGASVLLEHARPTHVGRGLIDEIRRWDAYYAGYTPSASARSMISPV